MSLRAVAELRRRRRVQLYGPPKSCKTVLATISSPLSVYICAEKRLLLLELLRIPIISVDDKSPSSLMRAVLRAVKLSRVLYGSARIVIDPMGINFGPTLVSFLELYNDLEKITIISGHFIPFQGFDSYRVSIRNNGELVIVGPGVFESINIETLFSYIREVGGDKVV